VEGNLDNRERMPPITVTIANNDIDFVIRYGQKTVLRRGGGGRNLNTLGYEK